MALYGEREKAVRPVLQIAMPRLTPIYEEKGESGLNNQQTDRSSCYSA